MARICFSMVFLLMAIDTISQVNKKIMYGGHAITIRTNPGSFLEHEAGIMLGVGYRWSQRHSATFDPMFIFYKPYPDFNSALREKTTGFKIKSDFRHHVNRFLGFRNVYFAPDLHYKNLVSKRWETFGINCIQGQCDYYMYAAYRQVMNEIGAAIKGGIEVFSNNDRWYLELYGGFGFKLGYYKEKGIPPGASLTNPPARAGFFTWAANGIAYPNLPGGLKLGYRIF